MTRAWTDLTRHVLAASFLAYGAYSSGLFDRGVGRQPPGAEWTWIAVGLGLYLAVCLSQWLPSRGVQVYGLWAGAFLVTQSLISPRVLAGVKDYRVLPSNMNRTLNVVGDAVHGVEGLQRITTDEKGFRVNPRIEYGRKEEYRVFAIGASTTEQLLIDDTRTWTHLLQEMLRERLGRPASVINTGVSGVRAVHNLATLKEVLQYQPDMALFLLGVNDWNRHIRENFGSDYYRERDHLFRYSLLGRAVLTTYLAVRGALAEAGEPIDYRGEYYSSQWRSLERSDARTFLPDQSLDDYLATLEAISATCREATVVCVFLTQPSGYSRSADPLLIDRFWMTPPNESYTLTLDSMIHIAGLYNRALMAFCERHGHPVVDVAAVIEPSLASFFDDVHLNLAGSRALAEHLAPRVEEIVRASLAQQARARGAADAVGDRTETEGILEGLNPFGSAARHTDDRAGLVAERHASAAARL